MHGNTAPMDETTSDATLGDGNVREDLIEAARKAGYGDPSDGQDYLDRDRVPIDPAAGLISGTAIDGTSDIPGDHENQEAVDDGSR